MGFLLRVIEGSAGQNAITEASLSYAGANRIRFYGCFSAAAIC